MRAIPLQDRRWSGRTWGLAAAAVHVALAALTAGPRLRKGLEDTDLYFRYATRVLAGKVPYRDFPLEYPPLALPLFLGPKAVAPGLGGFKVAFAAEMLLFNAATVLLVASWVGRRQGPGKVPEALAWYTLYFLILSRLMVTRYDAAPMLLGFGASVWWASGRAGRGGLAAAVGALAKVYPGVVALVGLTHDLVRPGPGRGRGAAVFGLTTFAGGAAWLALGGAAGVSASLRYHRERGFEYGSVYSGVQMLAAAIAGVPVVVSRDHASFSTVTPWSASLGAWVLPILSAALAVVCGVFARRGAGEVVRYSGAAVLAFVVTGKVFSPQYLLWLIPFVASLEGAVAPRGRRLFAAVCAATLLAPAVLGVVSRTSLWVVLAYNLRNVLVVWLLVYLVFGPRAGRDVDNGTGG